MTRSPSEATLSTLKVAAILLSVTLIVAILHLADVVLIPIALAVLLTFILSPLVTRLDHWGLGRVPAVLVVVGVAGLLLASLTWVVVSQLSSLANDLPNYRVNIREKVAALSEGASGGVFEKVQATFEEASREVKEDRERATGGDLEPSSPEEDPIPVRVVPDEGAEQALSAAFASLLALSPALGGLATAGFALVLVLFMLIDREGLRNRLVSLTSEGNLATTTKALDDAGQRISRYLIMQLIINGTFGLAVGIGLLLIGVPYALLWGLCAAVFRYIPYVGPWVAALLPLTVSLITSPGWTQVLLVLGLFLVLELLSNNIMEPWLYGHGVGVSVVALLVSAAFWTWTWGPIGLVLATPLTVCLVVVGKYVPALAFLDRLLGDKPAMQPHVAFLQRLLARDDEEATEIIQEYCEEHPCEIVYDEVFLPALELARHDRSRGSMDASEEASVLEGARAILAEISPSSGKDRSAGQPAARAASGVSRAEGNGAAVPEAGASELRAEERAGQPQDATKAAAGQEGADSPVPPAVGKILGCPAHKEAEELTLNMLDQLTRPAGFPVEVLSTRILPSDVADWVKREQASVVVIAVLLPGGLVQARYLCKFLRKRFPELGIVVGCWGYKGNLDQMIVKLRSAGAHYVTTTLLGAKDHVISLAGRPAPPRDATSPTAGPASALGV